MSLAVTCDACGSRLSYDSPYMVDQNGANDEQAALTKWLDAHAVCRARGRVEEKPTTRETGEETR